ncbi:MAG: AraC family transcriptional regulator, partial [Planctomycetota bacterium]
MEFFKKLASIDSVLAIFELVPDYSFFVKDLDGKFVAMNSVAADYCGVESPDKAIGKTDHDFFPKQRADNYRADDLVVIESGLPLINRIESAPESEGSPRLVITRKIPLRDKNGKVIGVAGVSRSIEKLKNSEPVSLFAKAVEHIHETYHERLSTKQLAKVAGLSESQLERRFRHSFGCSIRQYLIRVRVEHASRLLSET